MADSTMSFIDHRAQHPANIESLVVKQDNEELSRLCSILEKGDKKDKVQIDVHPSEVEVKPTIIVNVPDKLRAEINLTAPVVEIPPSEVVVHVHPVLGVKNRVQDGIIIGLLTTDIFVRIWGALWH